MNPNADASPYVPQPLPDGETLCRMTADDVPTTATRTNLQHAVP